MPFGTEDVESVESTKRLVFGCGKSEKSGGLSGELAVMKVVWIRQGFLESLSVLVPVWLPTS